MSPDRLLYVLDLFGVAVFAASGALAALAARVDLLGVLVLASITAVGGGTLLTAIALDLHPPVPGLPQSPKESA